MAKGTFSTLLLKVPFFIRQKISFRYYR